ncbi:MULTISPECIES: sulfur carrier protein ThiS [Mangrovibacter]|uniref:Sulfur carrier protein ThiS n=1 Tax=Mangrovibacter plantisponsor TaxID=451513 RepID=A0A317PH81_9ENTR|nr:MULTISPECIES: sulfur carrier protein ThiS [Mangrovibacter]KEA54346.1 thiamine biosynthesis protein ThiS [Mangrovibacter sp. MFB070]PWV99792.1 sulfur carrier protein ThiS [Mangrovibacter plantisponsor]
MQIQFNDHPVSCAENTTVVQLLSTFHQLKPGTALALNQTILPREHWDTHILQPGDDLLLFEVIAGG